MRDNLKTLFLFASVLWALLQLGVGACKAQSSYTVSLDTSSLIANANGPFSLDFQLNDGSGTNDANNTATLTGFQFGSGAATGTSTLSGGALGNLSSGITLTDSSFVNELYQSFTPGNTLSFNLTLTGNADVGSTPDEFSFAILDSSLSEIPTTGAAGAFLIADITPTGIMPQTFAGADPYTALSAPAVTPTAVPELGTSPVFGLSIIAGLVALLLRKRAAMACSK